MWKRLLLLGLVVGSAVLAYATGLHEQLTVANLRGLVERAGIWGPVLFVLLFGLEGLGLPGILFMLTSIAIWPPWQAFLLNWLGAQMAGIVGFSAARGIGREWLSTRLPARVQRFEKRLVERGLETVVIVRVLFFLAPYAHWALGLSPVSFRTFLLGSAIGFLPAMLIISLTGAAAFEWLAEQPRELWMGLGAVFLASVMGWRFWISRRSGRADRSRAARRDRR